MSSSSSSTRRRGKVVPRLPLSAFAPNAASSDVFSIPPTPSLISPSAIVDAHLQIARRDGAFSAVDLLGSRAVVLSSIGHPAQQIVAALDPLQSDLVDARLLAVLIPFGLESTETPQYLSRPRLGITTVYDGATLIAPEAEDGAKDQAQPETPVENLRWALQHARVVDLDIKGGIMATTASFYDGLVNLLTKANTAATRTPIVLTSLLPPPLDSVTPVVAIMNHPTYTTYRQRVSLLSLFENVHVKLLPPTWLSTDLSATLEASQLRDVLKLFIVPVLEAFGFERIVFGSSPVSEPGSLALATIWHKLVLDSFRELAVSQEEMDKIFVDNAERVYGSA